MALKSTPPHTCASGSTAGSTDVFSGLNTWPTMNRYIQRTKILHAVSSKRRTHATLPTVKVRRTSSPVRLLAQLCLVVLGSQGCSGRTRAQSAPSSGSLGDHRAALGSAPVCTQVGTEGPRAAQRTGDGGTEGGGVGARGDHGGMSSTGAQPDGAERVSGTQAPGHCSVEPGCCH